MTVPGSGPRFLQLADVAETLNISAAQVYALVRSGELPAIKIGGRGQWRVEASELEAYIARMYDQTREFVSTHRFGRAEDEPGHDHGPAAAGDEK
jgi:excisionase family DNA binding protein